MLKRLLLAAVLLSTGPLAHAQKEKEAPAVLPIDADTKLITYTGVMEVPDAPKNELYARGKVFFANTFKSAQNVIQADDKEAGLLIGKGWEQTYVTIMLIPAPEKLWYTVRLSFKDGKYRYSISDFKFEGEPSKYNYHPTPYEAEKYMQAKKDGTPTGNAAKFGKALDDAARAMVASIQSTMSKPAAGGAAGSKDW